MNDRGYPRRWSPKLQKWVRLENFPADERTPPGKHFKAWPWETQ